MKRIWIDVAKNQQYVTGTVDINFGGWGMHGEVIGSQFSSAFEKKKSVPYTPSRL
jgi:hypothetical protein